MPRHRGLKGFEMTDREWRRVKVASAMAELTIPRYIAALVREHVPELPEPRQ